jgi:hypothetical protein
MRLIALQTSVTILDPIDSLILQKAHAAPSVPKQQNMIY